MQVRILLETIFVFVLSLLCRPGCYNCGVVKKDDRKYSRQWRRNEFESGGGGAPVRREAPEFFLVVPLHFLALKAQLVVLVSAFVMVSTVWSVYFCRFSTHVPPMPSHL